MKSVTFNPGPMCNESEGNSLIWLNCLAAVLLSFCLSISARAQTVAPPFQFTAIDEKLLAEANDIDSQFEKKGLLYRNPNIEAYLDNIAAPLIGDGPAPERVVFKFRILRDPMVNAFGLPNGTIYVNTGLLAAMENEAQLVGVLAHEITHVTHRHSYRQNRSVRKKAVAMDVLAGVAAASSFFPAGAVFGAAVRFGSSVSQVLIAFTMFGYSQDLEREADRIGFTRMTRANYDGADMVHMLEHLDEKFEFEPVEPFWRTHPKLQERLATARKVAATENAPHPRTLTESEYLPHVVEAIRYNVSTDLDSRRPRTAVARAQRLVNWAPDDALNRTLLADAYRSLGAKTLQPTAAEVSEQGKIANRKRNLKLTPQEEQKELFSTPEGKRTKAANDAKAEALYKEAILGNPHLPDPYRGLGMLYEDQAKKEEAVHEYRRYLTIAPPDVADRLRIERRLEKLN